MGEMMVPVMLETSGNQAFIFGTNKLRDVVGASQLVHSAGRQFVDEVLKDDDFVPLNVVRLADAPTDEKIFAADVLVLLQTSGKAILAFRDPVAAKDFLARWSRLVLEKAPGLDATGVVAPRPANFNLPLLGEAEDHQSLGLAAAIRDLHGRFEATRVLRPAPQTRFARLPVVAECAFSGLPAGHIWKEGVNQGELLSTVSYRKWQAVEEARQRFEQVFGALDDTSIETAYQKKEKRGKEKKAFFKYLHLLEKELSADWQATIHADGNGIGKIWIQLADHLQKMADFPKDDNKEAGLYYLKKYSLFSKELDDLAVAAFKSALNASFPKGQPGKPPLWPVLPVVIGGDDLTVVMEGKKALPFTLAYLEAFQEQSSESPTISAICRQAYGKDHGRLGLAAGISITKPHFPFSTSYELAEELAKSAKQAKELGLPSASLDFHVLYDSTVGSISEIRRKLVFDDRRLTAKPFLVAPAAPNETWAPHAWDRFARAVAALQAKANGKDEADASRSSLPSTQAHAVRAALFREEPATLEAEWKILLQKYGAFAEQWKKVESAKTLFRGDDTVFLDALEAKDFFRSSRPTESEAKNE